MQIVVPNDASYVTRSEFNTTLALIYCAQNHIGNKKNGYAKLKSEYVFKVKPDRFYLNYFTKYKYICSL